MPGHSLLVILLALLALTSCSRDVEPESETTEIGSVPMRVSVTSPLVVGGAA